jgi:stearoyl-CoA desaturase (delta-9 desaturase)
MKNSTLTYFVIIHGLAVLGILYHSWIGVCWLISLYILTGLGVTVGYHRLLSHRSFYARPWLRNSLVTAGALAGEGGPLFWVSMHRLHHQKTDQDGDPHDSRKGFWWSHMGWILDIPWDKFGCNDRIDELKKDRYLIWLNNHHMMLQFAAALIVLIGVYNLHGSKEAFTIFIWAFPLRIATVLHCTWLLNSAAHRFGIHKYPTRDQSTNCWWVALLTFGEGWHNNHHAFPSSARHGLEWYELDFSWYLIFILQKIGLINNVKGKSDA